MNLGYIIALLLILNCAAEKQKVQRDIKQFRYRYKCENNNTYSIAHFTSTKLDNKNDVIHYVISGRVVPTIIIRHVFQAGVNITIDKNAFCEEKLTNQSLTFTDDPKAQYSGIIISKIFPFIDQNDDILLSGDSIYYSDDYVQNFTWVVKDADAPFESAESDVKFLGTSKVGNLGKIDFSVKIHNKDGDDEKLPGYPLRANLSDFKLELIGLPTKVRENQDKDAILRYSAEVIFFTANLGLKEAKFETKKSIDDEHTPGTFKLWGINFPLSKPEVNIYGCWKPVAYRQPNPDIENDAFAYNNIFSGDNKAMDTKGSVYPYTQPVETTLAYSSNQIQYFGINVTFGQPKDGGYSGSNPYIVWSGMIGSGTAPLTQDLSDFAITVITIGLGGPAVAGILVGVLVGIIRRLRGSNTPKSKYDRIN